MKKEQHMDIQHLIIKSIYAALSAAERRQLEAWLRAPGHRAVYDRIIANLSAPGHSVEDIGRLDVARALRQVKALAAETIERPSRRRGLRRWLGRAVAGVAVVAGVGIGLWWYEDYTRVTPPQLSAEVRQGIRSAIRHESLLTPDEVRQPSAPLDKRELETFGIGEREDVARELMDAKRVRTYINKEYWLTLPDGTMVHLADDSRLIYPETFGRGDRNVCLEGEGYFLVAHDRSRRFIVHTPHGRVCDYGTEFDVNTRDISGTSVVLVSGSVGVIPAGGRERLMLPGQKADIVDGGVVVQPVDTAPYTAWNTGRLAFRRWPLRRIMAVVGKWYGRQVVFLSEQSEQKTFSGTFDRYDGMESTLEAIREGTGLQIETEKDRLVVY